MLKRFVYKAKDDKGRAVTGEVEANSLEHAAKLVRERGMTLISISPKLTSPLKFLTGFREKVSSGDLSTFTRQLATMINAGLPITEALLILRSQSSGAMQSVVSQVLADVEEGESLSKAMVKHPKVFSQTYVSLVKSGELGGVMEKVLLKMADDLEKQQDFRGRIKSSLIYPIIIVIGMIIVALIMLVFVIPRLTTLYEQFDAKLPLSTRILIGISNMMVHFWPLVIIGVGLLIYGLKVYRNTPDGRKFIDDVLFKIPVAGDLQRQIILTEVTRTLSLMIGAGVSIVEALNITARVVQNTIVSTAMDDIAKMVEKGFPLAFAFSRHPEAFPFILSQMIAVGEETGKMDEVLSKVSHIFEVESEQKLKALSSAVEPIILIFLGVGVGFMVVSIILPIYNLTSQF